MTKPKEGEPAGPEAGSGVPGEGDMTGPSIHAEVPGPASRELAERLRAVEPRGVTHLSERFTVSWDRAEGVHVWDADGNRYVDLTAGFGVAAVGHGHPRVVEAVREGAARLLHGMGDVHPPPAKVELLERLVELAPMADARAVLTTSGSEAIEVALKTARLHTGKPGVLAFTDAYHGLTYGALSVTDGPAFGALAEGQLDPHVLRAGYPNPFRPPERLLERLEGGSRAGEDTVADAALADVLSLLESPEGERVGAVILEPIQGRGGQVVPPDGFLAGLSELCRERDVLLILDEILTGFGRTGRRFACDHEGVEPDLICVGKALSGGMPIAACVGRREVTDTGPPAGDGTLHTSTFAGHPPSCAAALACLDVIEEKGLAARADELGEAWLAELREMAARHPAVGDVRGRGLLVGLELVGEDGRSAAGELAARVAEEALARGWILLPGGPAGNVLSLSPPLVVERETLTAAAAMLDEVLGEVGGGRE